MEARIWSDEEVRKFAIRNLRCEERHFNELIKDPTVTVEDKIIMARHRDCPESVLKELIKDENLSVVEAVLERKGELEVPYSVVKEGLKGTYREVVEEWYARVRNHARIWSEEESLKHQLQYPFTEPAVFERVMATRDLTSEYKEIMGRNPACPNSVLKQLIKDKNLKVVEAVLSQKNLDESVISEGLKGPNRDIVQNWIDEKQREKIKEEVERSLIKQLDNERCPTKVLEALSKHKDSKIREKVALNPNCPSWVLDDLSKDASIGVRTAVGCHRNTSEETLKRLIQDKENLVVRVVLERPKLPLSVLEAGLQGKRQEFISEFIKRQIANKERIKQQRVSHRNHQR